MHLVIHNHLRANDAYRPGQVIESVEMAKTSPSSAPYTMMVRYEPSTGASKPFEVWSGSRRVASYKTDAAALAALRESKKRNEQLAEGFRSGRIKYDNFGRVIAGDGNVSAARE